MTTVVRFPRSLQSLPGESLAGYVLNLAHRLDLPPGEVACRAGLFTHKDYTSLNLQFAAQPLCGARLDMAPTSSATNSVLDLQRRLDQVLDGQIPSLTTLGMPVTSVQYLRDLRLVAVLLQVANDRHSFSGLPTSYVDATMEYLHERRDFRNGAPTHHRTWSTPPSDPLVTATLLTTAASLLDGPDTAKGIEHLVDQALANERARWTKVRWLGRPSERLAAHLSPGRGGLIANTNLRRAAAGRSYLITADQIPAYLDVHQYERLLADIPATDERALRRTVPLGLVRLITGRSATDAAHSLGISPKTATTTTERLAMDLGKETSRRLQVRIAELAAELDTQPQAN